MLLEEFNLLGEVGIVHSLVVGLQLDPLLLDPAHLLRGFLQHTQIDLLLLFSEC